MREILFKAKRIDNGEWVEGDYSQFCDSHYIHVRLWALPLKKYLKYKKSEFEVDPNTICQFTGLTDKNGKRIWENDICNYRGTHNDNCVIRYGEYTNNTSSRHYGFYTEWETFDYMLRQDLGYWAHELEVIGNKFDNPELLERQRKKNM